MQCNCYDGKVWGEKARARWETPIALFQQDIWTFPPMTTIFSPAAIYKRIDLEINSFENELFELILKQRYEMPVLFHENTSSPPASRALKDLVSLTIGDVSLSTMAFVYV